MASQKCLECAIFAAIVRDGIMVYMLCVDRRGTDQVAYCPQSPQLNGRAMSRFASSASSTALRLKLGSI